MESTLPEWRLGSSRPANSRNKHACSLMESHRQKTAHGSRTWGEVDLQTVSLGTWPRTACHSWLENGWSKLPSSPTVGWGHNPWSPCSLSFSYEKFRLLMETRRIGSFAVAVPKWLTRNNVREEGFIIVCISKCSFLLGVGIKIACHISPKVWSQWTRSRTWL